jgi:hypothetical protein
MQSDYPQRVQRPVRAAEVPDADQTVACATQHRAPNAAEAERVDTIAVRCKADCGTLTARRTD